MEVRHLLSLCILSLQQFAGAQQNGLCWKPGSNPFYGPPRAIRIAYDKVKLEWSQVFNSGPECSEVDFMVKSHPKFKPAQYKLSDFTSKGQREAVLKIDPNGDFVFQIIAREDKGPKLGIDYKYSQMATSLATDLLDGASNGQPGNDVLRQVSSQNYRKILNGDRSRSSGRSSRPVKVINTVRPQPASFRSSRVTSTATSTSRSQPQRSYRPPPTRSLSLPSRRRTQAAASSSSNEFNKCLPVLNNMAGFGHGSSMKKDRLVINFIRHLNKRPSRDTLEDFLKTRKSCNQNHEKGYLVTCPNTGSKSCCPSPWSGCGSGQCDSDYAECDGRCMPSAWVGDGWPDCVDGSDEVALQSETGRPMSYQLQCIQCSGVVLSAAYMCSSSGQGINMECMEEMMGAEGGCNVCIGEFIRIEN